MTTKTAFESYVVVVPKPGSLARRRIDHGSGIVVAEREWMNPNILVYYEGNRYHAENLHTFAERVKCAAGRLQQRYPTVARGMFPANEFTEVGTFVFAADWSMEALAITDDATLAQLTGPTEQV